MCRWWPCRMQSANAALCPAGRCAAVGHMMGGMRLQDVLAFARQCPSSCASLRDRVVASADIVLWLSRSCLVFKR
jgi:hypothetical protein